MKNRRKTDTINMINEIANTARKRGIAHLYTEDEMYNGKTIKIGQKQLINFGSCSYLGLELDDRLKEGAINAIRRYGIQFSSSRSYVSCTLYTEWEELIGKMFNAPVVLPPTTTLGHYAVIPVVVEEGDAIILDQQVHASVQDAAFKMQLKGIPIAVLRHNQINELKNKIQELMPRYNRIWYMLDGIYSMYGDFAPIERLIELDKIYKQLYLYIDDAHGMSIMGKNGTGYVMSKTTLQSKMIVGYSFAKAYGAGGAAFIFPNECLARKVKNCGGPMIFSGPHQIPVIGAGIASAKIHLSEEIYHLQASLKEKVRYCHHLLEKYRLPVVSNPETPIFFIGLGLRRVAYNMVNRMMNDGCYVNPGVFPAVPENCSGIRFTITNHHTLADIEILTERLAYHFPKALHEEGRTIEDIHRAFKKMIPLKKEVKVPRPKLMPFNNKYIIKYESTIQNIPKVLWNSLLGKEAYDWDMLHLLEQTFKNNIRKENNWDFYYYLIFDKYDKPALATFFTHALVKEDMLAPAEISRKIELERINNPYYLCSYSLIMGCLLTEGKHLYIDRNYWDWKHILMLLLDVVWKKQEELKVSSIIFRDFNSGDTEIKEFFMDQGFVKVNIADTSFIENLNAASPKGFLQQFKSHGKKYIKNNVLKYEHFYDVKFTTKPTAHDLDLYYQLYKNIKNRSFEINTFDLPEKLFENMGAYQGTEIMELHLKPEYTPNKQGIIAGVTFSMITAHNNYNGLIIGLDYDYLKSHNIYKQVLYQTVVRAIELKVKNIYLGYTASEVKQKFGAKRMDQVAYFQDLDQYSRSIFNVMPIRA